MLWDITLASVRTNLYMHVLYNAMMIFAFMSALPVLGYLCYPIAWQLRVRFVITCIYMYV